MTTTDLHHIPFFHGIGDQQLWHLSRAGEAVTYAPNDALFDTGAPRLAFWVVLEGNVAIESVESGIPHRLSTLGAGDVLGESILLDEDVHSSTARATVPVRALRAPSATDFVRRMRASPARAASWATARPV